MFTLVTSLPALAAPGDTLFVAGDNVNVRANPSTDAPVIMQLNRGHVLTEVEQREDWVWVGFGRAEGEDGWIHQTLVTADDPGGETTAFEDTKFDRFKTAVASLNERIKTRVGFDFFTGTENLGAGVVQVTASDEWLSVDKDLRLSNLQILLDLWQASERSGTPIEVQIVDGVGKTVMTGTRP